LSVFRALRQAWETARRPDACNDDYVVGRPRKKQRRYRFVADREGPGTAARLGFCLCILVLVVSAGKLIAYIGDYHRLRQASQAMRNAYYEDQLVSPSPAPSALPAVTAQPESTGDPATTAAPTPTITPMSHLEKCSYPYNPYRTIDARFAKLRRQNADIIGWLKIDEMLDEAVVQRDNDYYLDRDYRGYHNVNGAIFLEQTCDLSTRPYTYLIYGHNMKSGAMFGCLRNYENLTFCRINPFITFDTLYEEGRYVVFAVATVSLDASSWRFVDFTKLHLSVVAYRQNALNALVQQSKYISRIGVLPQDQLLLLVTCVDDDAERRVVAARRIREGESEDELLRLSAKTNLR